jgi:hypothetical protein
MCATVQEIMNRNQLWNDEGQHYMPTAILWRGHKKYRKKGGYCINASDTCGNGPALNDIISFLPESVSLELDNIREMVDEEILLLVKTCKRLRDFTLNAVILVSTIQEIMELQKERKIGKALLLKYILIYIKKVLVKEMKKTKPMNF